MRTKVEEEGIFSAGCGRTGGDELLAAHTATPRLVYNMDTIDEGIARLAKHDEIARAEPRPNHALRLPPLGRSLSYYYSYNNIP